MIKKKIKYIENFVKKLFDEENSGHDWTHINRVRCLALHLAKQEKVKTIAIIECASLLHEIFDYKFCNEISIAESTLLQICKKAGFNLEEINKILEIARQTSWSLSYYKKTKLLKMIELDIVQDADRLDSIGAIGLCRNIIYGTTHGEKLFDGTNKSNKKYDSFKAYRSGKTNSIIEYTIKRSLKVNGLLKTNVAIRIGKKRHLFMLKFIRQFKEEWSMSEAYLDMQS